ncbi:hypothetical protein ACFWM1_33435 [Nocardia sp. NPDC058379]|uniref:hypothetical protein n=1 Tax=unclassified Nocardia TaxID=2637762 RepID=UPI00364FA8EB
MNLRCVLVVSSIIVLAGCAQEPDDSAARYPAIPSTSPKPSATQTDENRDQWCEPAAAQWDEKLGLTVDFATTPTELIIRYIATNNRTTPVYAINRIQQDTGAAAPRERHFVVPRSDDVVEISQRQFRYRSPNCVVPRSMPLPPPLASRIEPGSTLTDTIHVPLPLRVIHPEGPPAAEYLPPLTPHHPISFCLGFSSTADPDPRDVDGEPLYDVPTIGPETVACSTPLELP